MRFKNKEDLIEYLRNNRYGKNYIDLYVKAYDAGLSIDKYIVKDIKYSRLSQIMDGLIKGVDVGIYDDYKLYRTKQMAQIKNGLLYGVDVTWYANPDFNESQMKVILQGLRRGIDVSIYADPKISSSDMWSFYNRIIKLYNSDDNRIIVSNSRYFLEDFLYQRVDFTGIIKGCRHIYGDVWSILVSDVYWNDIYVTDHAWISMDLHKKDNYKKNDTFDFGDSISFSAVVEKYLHNSNRNIHLGLKKIGNIKVLSKGCPDNYRIGSIIKRKYKHIEVIENESFLFGYERFVEKYHPRVSDIENDLVLLNIVKFENDKIKFEVVIGENTIKDEAYYNPINNKEKIIFNDFYIDIASSKSRIQYKLIQTYFLAHYYDLLRAKEDNE